jgi:hypothetical protein
MGGAIPGDLIAIAGMSGEGKTTCAMNFARNLIQSGEKVLFFSYEVLVQFVWEKFKVMGLKDRDCVYCPFKNLTGNVSWIEQKIKEAKEKFDVRFVVIDHLGFLAPKMRTVSNRSMDNYSLYLTSVMRDLKTLAKNEEIVVILPVHMRKRESFYKKNVDLDINDIANSAGISQESDLVFIVQREKDTRSGNLDVYTGFSSIILAKNRRGSKNPKAYFSLLNELYVYDDLYFGLDSIRSSSRNDYSSISDQLQNDVFHEESKDNAERERVNRDAGLFDDEDDFTRDVKKLLG